MPYTPTTWVDGSEPAITAALLNNMEMGIKSANDQLALIGYPVPVTSLKQAEGSSDAVDFIVHHYTFGSPQNYGGIPEKDEPSYVYIASKPVGHTGVPRRWLRIGPSLAIIWDYLTASGHPRVWAEIDDRGEIVSMWEAEDPADGEFPDEPPFEPGDDRVVVPVEPPDGSLLEAVTQRLERAAMPRGFGRSIYAADPPPRAVKTMLSRQLAKRGLEEPPDIREVLSIRDRDRRHWYLQLWMRQASRLLHDHRPSTLIPLYREMLRADRKSGRLELK